MRCSRLRAGIVAGLAYIAVAFGTASPVAAECTMLDPWPSFREAARNANRIVVGEVVEAYAYDSADNAITFQFRVDETLRGHSDPKIDFRDVVRSGAPLTICPGDSILRVRVGDVIAFAFDARVAGSPDPVLAVAYLRGTPSDFLMPGIERVTLAEVRSLAALPKTDAAMSEDGPPVSVPIAPLLVAGLLGAVAFFLRTRHPDT